MGNVFVTMHTGEEHVNSKMNVGLMPNVEVMEESVCTWEALTYLEDNAFVGLVFMAWTAQRKIQESCRIHPIP